MTVDNALAETALWWKSRFSYVYEAGGSAWQWYITGTISCVIDVASDLIDGGFKVKYDGSGYIQGTIALDQNCSNLSIIGLI
jgi:hypothetical protein